MKFVPPIVLVVLVSWWIAGLVPRARAHGELHDLIQLATQDIARNPGDPLLYLKRAELHRAHRGWDAAMADIERAAALSNQWHAVHFARAELYLDTEWFESAAEAAGRFLAAEPDHVAALIVRARARAKLGQHLAAAADYSRAIAQSSAPGPELFLERAQALSAAGGEQLDDALRGVEEGITKLGPIVTLQLAAIELELQLNRVDAALARMDAAMAQTPRKETWLVRRGELLRQAGRPAEAAAAFQAAWQALDSLPAARRRVPAMADLEQRIRSALADLKVPAPAPATPPR